MGQQQLIEYCRNLYTTGGLDAIRYPSLKKHKGLYMRLYHLGLKHRDLLMQLGVVENYHEHKRKTFTWDILFVSKVRSKFWTIIIGGRRF
jgi:hypothetical protein